MTPLLLSALLFAQEDPNEVPTGVIPIPETPDRSAPPEVEPPDVLALPGMTTTILRPGLTLSHLQVDGVRKVEIMVMFERGTMDLCPDSVDCRMLTNIWDLASKEADAEETEALLDSLDASLLSWMGRTVGGLELTIPRTALDDGLALLDAVLHTPGLPRSELRLSRENVLDWYENTGPADMSDVASTARKYGFYPAESVYGQRADLDGIQGVRRRHLRSLHAELLAEAPVHVLVVGDVTVAEIQDDIVALIGDLGVPAERTSLPEVAPMGASGIVAVDMPGPQAAVRLITEAPGRDDVDRVPLSVIDFALGGSFVSRLNGNLREEKGWTYGAGSYHSAGKTHGFWAASVDVEAENVAGAVTEIRGELDTMVASGVTEDEVEAAWLDQVTWWNRRLETAGTAASFYQQLILQDQTLETLGERLSTSKGLTPADSVVCAESWMTDRPRLWVIVGDRSLIEEQVDSLGLPVQWITPQQAILGEFEVAR
ncbi:MAG: zinc protease [Myxococcota bacterium]|jgi:zinc protease